MGHQVFDSIGTKYLKLIPTSAPPKDGIYADANGNIGIAKGGVTQGIVGGVANGLTAHAGGGQASALQLTAGINRVTTVATAADSVKLPAAKAGAQIVVINADAADSMNVFPTSGDKINALAADAAFAMAANKTAHFYCAVDGTWNSILTA